MASVLGSVAIPPVRQESLQSNSTAHIRGVDAQRVRATAFEKTLNAERVRWTEPKRTQLSAAEARSAIARAFEEQTGKPLSAAGQAILTAQWAHETAHGASMFNFNFGGIKGASPEGLSVAQRTREGYGNSERRIVDGFRAYSSAEQGANDYVQLLRSRYRGAIDAADAGDAEGFVRGLKEKGYFTGDPIAYARNISSLANQFGGEDLTQPVRAMSSPNQGQLARYDALNAAPLVHGQAPVRDLPVPLDLFRVMNGQGGYPEVYGDLGDLRATRALEMADQVTRAALRIALNGRDEGGSGHEQDK